VTDYFAGDGRSNRERMLAGDWYVSDDPDSWDQFKRAVRLQTRYTAAFAEDPDAARPILEELLGHLGEQAHIRPPLYVDYGSHISVGARQGREVNGSGVLARGVMVCHMSGMNS
jgi:maltose O-acetyltransferase